MDLKSLTWPQVNAWRLTQHCLVDRLERGDFLTAASRTGGIQAQVMSASEQALGVRVNGLTPGDVKSALWQERTLVKTWAMRGTLHLLCASDLPLFVAARSMTREWNWTGYFNYHGIPPALFEAYLAAAPQVLSSEPQTREQLAAALAEYTGVPELRDLVAGKGWGTPLKPLAWRGILCFGPNQGQNVTFVHPGKWLGQWQAVDPQAAWQEIARRYLRTYGPSTPEGFHLWWGGGSGLTAARKLFRMLEDELVLVDVEGWRAYALRSSLGSMQRLELSGLVRLLPLFDAYVLGLSRGLELEPLLAREYQKLVYSPQGWISAVILVDGFIKGIWEYKTLRGQTTIHARLFSPLSTAVRAGVAAEAERFGGFLNTQCEVVFESE